MKIGYGLKSNHLWGICEMCRLNVSDTVCNGDLDKLKLLLNYGLILGSSQLWQILDNPKIISFFKSGQKFTKNNQLNFL